MNAETDVDLDSFFIPQDKIEKEEEEPFSLGGVKRRARRYVARGIETIAGLPGDIVQTIRGVSQILPGESPNPEDETFVKRGARELLESLPGSAEFKASNVEQYPDVEPQSEFEEVEDEIVEDFSALALPTKGRIPFARSLGLSLIGNIGKKTIKDLGLGSGAQEATKMGLMLFSGMFGKGRGVNNYIKNLYKEAAKMAPKDARIYYPRDTLKNITREISKGSMNDAKEPIATLIEELKFKSPGGKMSLADAIQFDKDIGRAIGKAGSDKTKRGLLKQLKKAHSGPLNEYAQENPSWGELYKEAKQAYKGIETSQTVKNYIYRNMNLKNFTYASALLGFGGQYLPGSAGEKIGAVAGTAALLYSGAVAKRLATNPALRRYYANVVQASLNENKAMLARSMKGLNRVAKKEFEENPFPIFDIEED